MIAVLTPSRGRPVMLDNMIVSAADAQHYVYLDQDDKQLDDYRSVISLFVYVIVGPRDRLGIAWNQLARKAYDDGALYLMMGNDDLMFRSQDWWMRLAETLDPDVPAMAYFDDGLNGERHAAFPIVTRAWYETLDYFTPECFSFGYHDTWIFDVARRADCVNYIGGVLVEHLHPSAGKRPVDQTFQERNWSGDPQMFEAKAEERERDAQKIREAM